MKTNLIILSILATGTCALAAEKPDGILGTNMLSASGYYQTIRVDGSDYNYAGEGVGFNQNVYENTGYGLDVGFDFYHLKNTNNTKLFDYKDYQYTFSATVYKKGVVSPYITAKSFYGSYKIDYADNPADSYSDTMTALGGTIGAECHLLQGWSVTPYLSYMVNTEIDPGDGTTSIGTKTNYWLTPQYGVGLDVSYYREDGAESIKTSFGVAYHF